jgi:ArsR family transcriptional regulator, arsenate/arsenite/antimonite-responsive transcriptional repressor
MLFDIERFFQALGDFTRLRLLNLMGEHELCVCYFVEILGQPQPKISRHLAYLRNAGIVAVRRQGTWMHYRLVLPEDIGAARILRRTFDWMKDDPTMQRDRLWFSRICRAPQNFAALAEAPAPTPLAHPPFAPQP